MKSQHIDLFENCYCHFRALTKMSHRRCYDAAVGGSGLVEHLTEEGIRSRIKRLEKEPKIIQRIEEIAHEGSEKWDAGKEVISQLLFEDVLAHARGEIQTGKDTFSTVQDAYKAISLLADFHGWRKPDKVEIESKGAAGAVSPEESATKMENILAKIGVSVAVDVGVVLGNEVEKVGGGGERGRDIPVASEEGEIIDIPDEPVPEPPRLAAR